MPEPLRTILTGKPVSVFDEGYTALSLELRSSIAAS